MAREMTTVVKMTVDSKDYETGLQNAKASMNKFSMNTQNMGKAFEGVMGGMAKKIGLIGVALAAKDGFKQFMRSTEEMSDAFDNTMGGMKDAWKSFLFQVNNGNFQGFRDLIDYATKARWALDSLSDAAALFSLDYGENQAQMTELISQIQKKRKSGQDYSGEMSQYNTLLGQLRDDAAASDKLAYEALFNLFAAKGVNLHDYGLTPMEAARLGRKAASGQFADVERLKKAYNTKPDISELNDFDIEASGYNAVSRLRDAWGMTRFNEADMLRTLGNITTEEKVQIENILKEISARRNTLASLDKQLNRYLQDETGGKGGSGGGGSTASRGAVELVPMLPPLQQMDEGLMMMEKINASMAVENVLYKQRIDELNAYASMMMEKINASMERQRENEERNSIIMAVENELYKQRIDELNAYASALSQVGSMFAGLTKIAADGSPWQKFASAVSGVMSEISGLISTYTALVAIEGVAESIKAGNGIPFPYNLIAIAAAGSALVGIIATLKGSFKDAGSFAGGGIVGGNSYSGDRLIAHVNSGEMILNQSQQAALFGGGRNVNFIIEGSQLKGVLDNYNKTEAL